MSAVSGPVPCTTKLHRLEENIGGAAIKLTAKDLRNIETAVSVIAIQGDRYSPQKAASFLTGSRLPSLYGKISSLFPVLS